MLSMSRAKCLRQLLAKRTTAPALSLITTPTPSYSKAAVSVASPRFFSDTKPQQNSAVVEKSMLGKIMDRFSLKGAQKRILTAEMLFQAATRQANDPNWYGPGRIPRDFRSRHAILTMHLWFLHKRLISASASNGSLDTDTCLKIQEELFEIFWNDTLCRLRAQSGVRELSVNKYLLQVQQYTFLHLFHYDHIFGSLASSASHLDQPKDEDDGEEPLPPMSGEDMEGEEMDPLSVLDPNVDLTKRNNRISELKKLIWMHIMVRDPKAKESDDHLERIAWYMEAQYQNILVDWPGEFVEEARVKWVNLPDFGGLKNNDGRTMEKNYCHPDDVIPEPWLTNITLRGDYYYWNPTNGKSQWKKPISAEG